VARYATNRLRVVRQVRYSLHNENSIDVVLFLNGLPVATVELKTDFTQSIGDAIDQYRFDRQPKPKGQGAEPLLTFPSGALIHFAVSNQEVAMVTQLAGPATVFLPFNLGDDGAAGNPVNAAGGHRTAYLWEQVWARESWLEILGRYLIARRNKKKQIEAIIFPRYHQLDVTRKLQAAILVEGPGGKYLIQHSAGSGKTNSIAWTAHFLAELHDAKNQKVFDTVLVVSDRNVIDVQLQEALFDFQRTTGVVATITNQDGSKSGRLAEALSGDKKIVVCTIQTFPFALEAVRRLAATQGKRFAVIADEAHSSQTGEAASKLKAVLSPEELQELNDGGEISTEDILAAQMASRAEDGGITFVAFTATPKNKTLELFGTRPDPARKPAADNLPKPFHVYSMRQAIEEGFILDVLQNYLRLYTFLSQIFDYGNTGIEKRAIFYKRLLPLLEFGREREGIDLSKVVLTHHHLKDQGARTLPLSNGETPKLAPITEAGSGSVQEQQKVYMAELISKLNDLFGNDTSEQDQLRYVNGTILGKVSESRILQQQAANNTREQFANSPDLHTELQNAIIESYDAHTVMSTQALNSPIVLRGILDVLLNHAGLYETLRARETGRDRQYG